MKQVLLSLLFSLIAYFATAQQPFITTWKTDNPGTSEDNQITIPTFPGEIYDYTVDWGDGTMDSGVAGDITHTYAAPGNYEVAISGLFPRIYFNYDGNPENAGDKDKIITVEQWGNLGWSSMEQAFNGCINLDVVATDTPDLSNVQSVFGMFYLCAAMQGNASFGAWDVSNVRNFEAMFRGVPLFNQDIGEWNVTNALSLVCMFCDAANFNQNIGNWDVRNVTNMNVMFQGASSFNQNIATWDVSNVSGMSGMFNGASSFNQDISSWNVGKVTNMQAMFGGVGSFNYNISGWDVSNVTNMSEMFYEATAFNQDIGSWNVSNVTEMFSMFEGATAFDQNLGSWDISQVETMAGMFTRAGLSAENYDNTLTGWNNLPVLKNGVAFDGGESRYCIAETARLNLINTHAWTIADGGKDCPFITTWKTDNPGISGDNQIIIPTYPGEIYNYTIEWGDGSKDTGVTGNITHTYNLAGTYEVSISGVFPGIYFNADYQVMNDNEKLIFINQWGSNSWISMEAAFSGCSNLNVLARDLPDLTLVTKTNKMFNYCSSLIGNTSMGQWDVSNVADMSAMFHGADLFNQNINAWDVGNVLDMHWMFRHASSFNQDLGSWDVSKVTSMNSMFYEAEAYNNDIGSWQVSNVEDMSHMFEFATKFNQDIGAWDVSNVKTLGAMFAQAFAFNQDISNWDVSNVTDMGIMFSNAFAFNQDISGWNVSKVETMRAMFNGALAFNQDIGGWDVSGVTIMDGMFRGAKIFNQYIGDWNVTNVTDMDYMFLNTVSFEQDISKWDISQVESMIEMFKGISLTTEHYDKILNSWAALPSLQTNVYFHGGYSRFCTSAEARQKLIDTYGWIIEDEGESCGKTPFVTTWRTDLPGGTADNQVRIPTHPDEVYNYTIDWGDGTSDSGLTGIATHTYSSPGIYTVTISGEFPRIFFNGNWDSNKILSVDQWGSTSWSSMANAFSKCRNMDVKATDIPDLHLVNDMSYMFSQCNSLVGNSKFNEWDVSSVTNMTGSFRETSLFNQEIGAWDVSGVTKMDYMFDKSINFNQYIGNWDMSSVVSMRGMFAEAESFNQDIGDWDVGQVTNMMSLFGGAKNFDQDISSWDIRSVQYISYMFFNARSFNQPIGNWDVSNLTDVQFMLAGARSFNQTLGAWNIQNMDRMDYLLYGTALSVENYDQTLIGWNNQGPLNPVGINAGKNIYCNGAGARQNLIDSYGWYIEDGGENCTGHFFQTTWKTDNPGTSGNNQITIPTFPEETYNYTVHWGDGSTDNGVTGNITHTYSEPGIYQVSIAGNFPHIFFYNEGDKDKLISVDQWGDISWESMAFAFYGCTNMDVIAMDDPYLYNVTSLKSMFHDTSSLIFNESIQSWNTTGIKDMQQIFAGATLFNQSIGNWDVGETTNMARMFQLAETFNQPIGNWDVSNVTDMQDMFHYAYDFNQDISQWDVRNVRFMSSMFWGATSFNQEIGNWNTGNVETMYGMFIDATAFNGDIGNWDVGAVTMMALMFADATSFNKDIGAWNVSAVTSMDRMMAGAVSFDQDLSNWDIGNVSLMTAMFSGAGLSMNNYDRLLAGWSKLPVIQQGVVFDAGNSQFCESELERQVLIDSYGWIITDGGEAPLCNQDSDNDGIEDHLDACLETPEGATVNADGCMLLAADNFSIEAVGESCPDTNNAQINIASEVPYEFLATINGTDYEFSNSLNVEDLGPGAYTICISSSGQAFEQCYALELAAADHLSGKALAGIGKLDISIEQGTAPYNIMVNGQPVLETFARAFSVSVQAGDYVEVISEKACEGSFSKIVEGVLSNAAFPNPTTGIFELALPGPYTEIAIDVFSTHSQLMSSATYPVNGGKVLLDISKFPEGVYLIKPRLQTPLAFKIVKY